MSNNNFDNNLESLRYDSYFLTCPEVIIPGYCSRNVPDHLRPPYIFYESLLAAHLNSSSRALEIGCGSGNFSYPLASSNCNFVATDLSEYSLKYFDKVYSEYPNTMSLRCDMESLPFPDQSFDVVASSGSLSYGDNDVVMHEVFRVLKPGGFFICVDSLNHNPIYRLNRYFHYLRRKRSRSTLLRMPTMSMIGKYKHTFKTVHVKYFGTFAWTFQFISALIGRNSALRLLSSLDSIHMLRKLAFKFVLVAQK